MQLVEYRTELYDDWFNFMGLSPPKTINYFNFDPVVTMAPQQENSDMIFEVSLSNRVIKQKRIVYDVFMMFGDVGGLNDFLALGLTMVFGFFSNRYMVADFVSTLFQFDYRQ